MISFVQNKLELSKTKTSVITFYIIGLIGFIIPNTKNIFLKTTPYVLLLSTFLIGLYHKKYKEKEIFVFLLIFVLGFFIEVIGVNTSLIFGSYTYGNSLGVKIFNTPLIIGINWLFLTYTSTSIATKFKLNKLFTVLIASTLMLIYDFILEQVAHKMDMWSWENNIIPIKNYISWWLIGIVFVSFIKIFNVETKNPLALTIFICQFLFLIILSIVL